MAGWEDMPAAIRTGHPSPAPIPRADAPVAPSARLLESLALLRKTEG